jgi:hypothetical protein
MLSMTDIELVIKVLIIVKLVCALDAKMDFACKASESTYNLREIFAGDLSKKKLTNGVKSMDFKV